MISSRHFLRPTSNNSQIVPMERYDYNYRLSLILYFFGKVGEICHVRPKTDNLNIFFS
jgi:hypothetical protein